jgi:predicted P-loop ATPase
MTNSEGRTMANELDDGYWRSVEDDAAFESRPQVSQAPERHDRGGSRPRRNDAEWMEEVPLVRDTKRRIMAKRQNVYLMLKHDPALSGLVALDEIEQRVVIKRPIPVDDESESEKGFPKAFDGVQRSRLQRYFEKNSSLPKFSENDIRGGVEDFAERVKFNALADHVGAMKWDGVMRMHRLFEHYFSCSHDGLKTAAGDSFYLANLSTWFLTGLVRRALQPGCTNQYVVIMSGKQGLRKSTGLKTLGGERWFSDRMPSFRLKENDPKRFYDQLRGKWLVEIAEGKVVKDADPDAVKEFLTQEKDEFKPAYQADQVIMPRSLVFVVTRNPEDGDGFLRDATGNRRFWPVDVKAEVRTDEIERDRDQLMAEAVEHVRFVERRGCGDLPFYPDKAFEKTYLEPLQAELVVRNEWDDVVAEFLETYTPDRVKPINIIRDVLGKQTAMPKELSETGRALVRTGRWRRATAVNAGYERVKAPSDYTENDLPF